MPEDIISGDDCADALEMLSYPGKQSTKNTILTTGNKKENNFQELISCR